MARRETNGAVTPRERHRLQTREEILDAALAVMAEEGVAALNLTEVARRVEDFLACLEPVPLAWRHGTVRLAHSHEQSIEQPISH